MVSENQRKTLEAKLALIEKEILDDNNRADANRMPARYFTLFFLIGAEDGTAELLQRKVQGLLSNPKACAFLQWDNGGEAVFGKQADSILIDAANNYVDVENLNTILLCPVCFSSTYADDLIGILESVHTYMNMSGKTPVWQPYLIISSRIEKYPETYKGVMDMQKFIATLPEGTAHRCCILSDQDERGFSVPLENILETIAVCTVLQNTKPENPDVAPVISQRVCVDNTDVKGGTVFFTARSASVSNPVRSLTYQRMISAANFLSGDTDSESNEAIKRMSFRFIVELLAPYIDLMPHDTKGNISFFPLYGVIEGAGLHQRLQEQINKYYNDPLYGDAVRAKLSSDVRQRFYREFFKKNGSLKELESLITTETLESKIRQHMGECFWDAPIEGEIKETRVTRTFVAGEYAMARKHCEEIVRGAGQKQLENLIVDLNSRKTMNTITAVRQCLNAVIECIIDRQRQLRDIETILGIDQNELHSDFGAVQDNWFENVARTDARVEVLNQRFDSMVCEMLLHEVADFSDILRVCYEAVKNRIESNSEYLKKLDEACSRNPEKANVFAEKVEQSWCYTLRFIQRRAASDVTCLIGNVGNSFCRTLRERFNAQQFEFSGLDKLGVLHISAAFEANDIFAWKQIEESGKKGVEASATTE